MMSAPTYTTNTAAKVTMRDFTSPVAPTWCPGCGDYAIWTAIKMALIEKNISPTEAVLCFDIGCNGNMADKINAYVFKGLHGRVIPVAAGIKLANKNIPVIAVAGDGGTFDEGIQHLVHAIRSNYDITLILHNNCDFGLTTGQATPTTPTGQPMNSNPFGVVETRLNPTQLVLTLNPTFVAKAYTGDLKHIVKMLTAAFDHKGFSYVEVLQHCPTYNKFLDQTWYKDRVVYADQLPDYDPTNLEQAYKQTSYTNENIPIGILYQNKESIPFHERIEHIRGIDKPLKDLVQKQDVTAILKEFK